jgi:AraC-like DNA-binding protein
VQLSVTEAGQFEAALTRIDLHRLWMQRGQEKLPRIVRSSHLSSRSIIFFLADDKQPAMHNTGAELPPGWVISYAPGTEHYQRTHSACHWAAMSLTPEDLAAEFRAITDRDLVVTSQYRLIRPAQPVMSRLMALHEAAGRLAMSVPDILAHPEVARAMEQELVLVMVSCLSDGLEVRNLDSRYRRISIMRRFEEMIEAEQDRPLYVSEICKALGVPARTLQAQCHEKLGMGPHRYLWLRRMNLARRALALADPATKTVTEIATQHGFWEFGRFAVSYRKLFGEPPSATLRTAPRNVSESNWMVPGLSAQFA